MNHTQNFIQQRKLYMALPVLVTPFLVMIFWALGGGAAASKPLGDEVPGKGLITTLPDAQLEGKEQWDKLSLYEQAKTDSMRYEEARENDPYFDLVAFKTSKPAEQQAEDQMINTFRSRDSRTVDHHQIDRIETAVQQKLSQLQKMISQPGQHASTPVQSQVDAPRTSDPLPGATGANPEIQQMEAMMNLLGEKNREPDPEMQQIEGVLEKLLDIQHPERVKERIQAHQKQKESGALPVQATDDNDITLLSTIQTQPDSLLYEETYYMDGREENGFFGLVDRQLVTAQNIAVVEARTAISAVIHDTQELVAGSTVRMRLTEGVTIAGISLPKDQFVYGVCEINGERLTIKINSIRLDNMLLPVALSAYDLDGLEGVHIPGAITGDASKQGTADAMQSMQMMSLNPSIGAQAAGAGIETVKGLLSKKARLIKVTVKAGYQVLLKSSGSSINQ